MTPEDRACPDRGGDVFDPWGLGPDPCRCEEEAP